MAKRKTDIHPSTEDTSSDNSVLSVECGTESTQQRSREVVEVQSAGLDAWSLRRLGSDVRQLETTSQSLGGKLRARDAHIAQLPADLDTRGTRIQRLQTDLQNTQTQNCQLVDTLRALQKKSNTLQRHTNEQSDLLQTGDDKLVEAKQRLESLQKELACTKEEFERAQAEFTNKKQGTARITECSEDIEAHNAALCAKVQDLELYIDGRKDEWAQLKYRLADYKNALAGMEQDINGRKAAAAGQERDKAELALRIVSLERRCAELDGRRAEREDANAELRATLDNRAKEVERLNKNVSRMHKEVTQLNIGIRTGQAKVNSLDSEIAKPDEEIAALAEALEKERSLSVDLATQLKTATGQIDKLQLRFEEHDQVSRQSGTGRRKEPLLEDQLQLLQNDASKEELDDQQPLATETEVCLLRNQLAQVTKKRDGLQAELLEANEWRTDSEVALGTMRIKSENLETELCAQRELIEVLENDSSAKRDNFDVFDEGAAQVSDFGTDIEKFDQNASSSKLNVISIPAQYLIVPLEPDDAETQYPLNKNVLTIGRNGDNDISISDNSISRVHARIILEGSQVIIEDMGSKNLFLVNSEATERQELKHGDQLTIGRKEFEFVDLGVNNRAVRTTSAA